jgi:hypothetical protein
MNEPPDNLNTRQEAREEKLRKKKSKIKQHGKGLIKIYKDAISKKTRG